MININTIETTVQAMGSAPTQPQLAELADFVIKLEGVYLQLRKAITAQRVRDWDFTIVTSGTETRQYTDDELTLIMNKSKANSVDRSYLTAFRENIESVYTKILDLLDLFREGTYVPNGIDGVGHTDKLFSFTQQQGSSFKFTDATSDDTSADAAKLIAIKGATTGTMSVSKLHTLTGGETDALAVVNAISTYGSPTITTFTLTGATTAGNLNTLASLSDTTELNMTSATSLSGSELEITNIYSDSEYTGKGALNLSLTGALASSALVSLAKSSTGTSGTIHLTGGTSITGNIADTKKVLLEKEIDANIEDQKGKAYTVTDVTLDGDDLKASLDALTSTGTLSTNSVANISGTFVVLDSVSKNSKYPQRGTAVYQFTDTAALDGSMVSSFDGRLTSGGYSAPNTNGIISNPLQAVTLTSSSKFLDGKSRKYEINGDGTQLAGTQVMQVIQNLTAGGKLTLVGADQVVSNSLADHIVLFSTSNARFMPAATTKVNVTDANVVLANNLTHLLNMLQGNDALQSLATSNVDGQLAEAKQLLADQKFKQRLEKKYKDSNVGAVLSSAEVLGFVSTPNFTGSLQVLGEVVCADLTQANTLLDHPRLQNRAAGKYRVDTSSTISSPTTANELQQLFAKVNASARLSTPQMSVSGSDADLHGLLSVNQWTDRTQRHFKLTNAVSTVELAALLALLSTGTLTTGSKITGTLADINNATELSKHANTKTATFEDSSGGSKSASLMNTITGTLDNGGSLSVPNGVHFEGTISDLLALRGNTKVLERTTKPYLATDDVSNAQITAITNDNVQFLGTSNEVMDSMANVKLAKENTLFVNRGTSKYELTDSGKISASDLAAAITAGNFAMSEYSTPELSKANNHVAGTITEIDNLIADNRWTTAAQANFAFSNTGDVSLSAVEQIVRSTSGNTIADDASNTTIVGDMAGLGTLAIDSRFATSPNYKQTSANVISAQDVLDIKSKTMGTISAPSVSEMTAPTDSNFKSALAALTLATGQTITHKV